MALHPLSLSIGLALTLGFICHASARAQIVADPSAPGNQRPTVLQTANGVPLINIQTPSAAGVSRNTYSQFDVGSPGAILNNSRTTVQTQLGGLVGGNPWIVAPARVILNEVNSSNPSHLNGYVEVAGQRAEVIIANPAGIQVNGGGFINASGVTLTTGTPVMNSGQLEAFLVRGGTVRVEGLGLDTSTVDATAILARAMEVNAGLWARDLTVITGSNEVKASAAGAVADATPLAGVGTAPAFMLDVAALGGMYAGKIQLVGTEAGLGVNNRGSLIAQEGEWVLQVDGSLINTGKLQARGNLSIHVSGALDNAGPDALISSQGSATIATGAGISNAGQAQIAASAALEMHAGEALRNTAGTIAADGAVQITAAGIHNTEGTMASAQSTLSLDSGTLALTNSRGTIEARERLLVASGALSNDQGLIQSQGALHIGAAGDLDNTQGTMVAGETVEVSAHGIHNTDGMVMAHQAAAITGTHLSNDRGVIQALNTLEVSFHGSLGNVEGTLFSGGPVRIHAADLDNTQGVIASDQSIRIDSTGLNNHQGKVQALGTLHVDTQGRQLTNSQGLLAAKGTLLISAGDIDNTQGTLAAQQDALIASAALNNHQGLIQSLGTLDIDASADLDNLQGTVNASGSVRVTAQGIRNTEGTVTAHQGISIASAALSNHQGLIQAIDTLDVRASGPLDNLEGLLAAGGHVQIRTAGLDNTQGTIASDQSLSFVGDALNNDQGRLQALDALDLDTRGQTLANTEGMLLAGGSMHIAVGDLDNTQGTLAAQQDVVIVSTALNNDQGLMQATGVLDIDTQGQALTNTNAAGHGMGAGGIAAGVAVLLATGAMDNTEGTVQSGGALDVATAGALTNLSGRIQAVGDTRIHTQGGPLDNTAGRIASQAALTLDVGDLANGALASQAGLIGSNGDLHIQAGAITNGASGAEKSHIWSAQTISLNATSFTNTGALSGSNVTLHSTDDVHNAADASIEASGNLGIATAANLVNAGQLIANQSLQVEAQDIDNTGRMEADHQTLRAAAGITNAAGASIIASNAIDIGATAFNNRGLVNANEAGGDSLAYIQAATVDNTGTGAIFGDRIAIDTTTLNNRPEDAGVTAPVIAARERLDIGTQTLNNEDGAFIYSDGAMAIGGGLDTLLTATSQAQSVNNLSANIEAIGELSISALALTNERRNASVSQVQVLDETTTLYMPSWWVNGQNAYVTIEITSNYSPHLYYLLDPASILSETPLVTPDGNVIYKVEVALDPMDSVYHAASGAYDGAFGVRERVAVDTGTVVLYAMQRQTGVANPDQVTDASEVFTPNISAVTYWQRNTLSYSDAYGRCTTNCTLLIVQPGYTDPQSIIVRDTHRYLTGTHPGLEVARTAHHTVVEDRIDSNVGAPASIRSGSDMRLDVGTALTNRYADILAGGVLDLQAAGAAVVNEGQTLKRTHSFQNTSHTAGQGSFNWTNPDISEVIGQIGGTISGAQQLNITARSLNNTDLARSTGLPPSNLPSPGQPGAGLDFLGISLPTASAPIIVPNNPLFQQVDLGSAGGHYLIQGAPGFAGYRTWLGSDYLIANLGHDPNLTQKRLGDGFYEQRLIREQVAQLTGRRFLEGYASDEAQYRALMDSGVAYAQQWNLVPGIALTAEQMARLTSDLVWLVEREVVLPDGTKTTALVPQVYVRQVPQGDFQASGALLAGNSVNLQIQEDLVNAGGRIEGGVVIAQAGRDLSNIGGLMQARSELLASAGRHVTITSPTHTTSFAGQYVNQGRTELAAIGEMKVTGSGGAPGARLSIEAGGDVVLQAASVSNASVGGLTTIRAEGDVRLQTVEVGGHDNTEFDARNYQRHSQSQEVGSSVAAMGDVAISAGNDVVARAANVEALGGLNVQAGNDITLEAGRSVSESDSHFYTKRSGLLSRKSNEEVKHSASDVAIGSSFSGTDVAMQAGRDIAIQGSSVNAQDLLLLDAGRDVSIASEQNSESGSHFSETKRSGFSIGREGIGYGKSAQSGNMSGASTTQAGSSVSGGDVLIVSGRDTLVSASTVVADDLLSIDAGRDVAIVAGVNTQASAQASQSSSTSLGLAISGMSKGVTLFSDAKSNTDGVEAGTLAAASTVGSLSGDVVITAGQTYRQTGSDVLALAGDIQIEAQAVEITEAREARGSNSQQSHRSTVVGAAPRNPVVDAIKGAKTTVELAQATAQTSSSRVQALGAAATALNAYNTAKQVADLVADPAKAASATIDFSIGTSKSHSQSAEMVDSGRASTVAGAGDVRIAAMGAGADSDLLVRGSDVSAGGNAILQAEGGVRLESGQDRSTLHSSSKSSGASIGVGVSFGASSGITLNASANKGQGNADGQDVVQRNTHVVAGNTARIESGADTTLAGATVSAHTVQAEVGGNLNIESRQDTGQFKSDQSSSGVGVSLCIPPFCYGASSLSASGGAQNIDSEFASVIEQSGIRAGDGGFQVNVQGNTTLTGGAITSTDKAVEEGRNRFETGGELSISDIQNHARYQADGYSLSVTAAGMGPDASTLTPEQQQRAPATPAKNEGSAGIGEGSGEASSVTRAAISDIAGDKEARTGDAEAGIVPIFDRSRVQKEIDAQIKITAEFGKQASKTIGDYATEKYNELKNIDPEEAAKWDEGGVYRSLAHAVVGALTGGAAGAAGAGLASLSAGAIDQLTEDMPEGVKHLVGAAMAAGVGAIAGGTTGAATAFNADMNNRQLHQSERALARRLAAKSGGKYTTEEIESALRNAGNTQTGESVVAGMVVDPARRDAIYDTGAVWTTGEDGWLVQVLPPQPDAELANFIQQNTGEVYNWYTPSSGSISSDPSIPRDHLTGKPLDDMGRYSQMVVLDGKAYEPKYFSCATTECMRTGANLDISDPASQAYIKALDAQIFKDIGKGITAATLAFPTGAVGGTLLITGAFVSLGDALTDSSFTHEAGKFIAQNGAEAFFREVLGHSPGMAARAASLIELTGGWDSFVQRARKEF